MFGQPIYPGSGRPQVLPAGECAPLAGTSPHLGVNNGARGAPLVWREEVKEKSKRIVASSDVLFW
jgi:hypothetical protein